MLGALVPLLSEDAEAAGAPRRLVVWYHPHGTSLPQWRPAGTQGGLQLGRSLRPLERFKQNLILVEGVDHAASFGGVGNSHAKNVSNILTGTESVRQGMGNGISIDQVIAAKIGEGTRFPSLQLNALNTTDTICYAGPGRKLIGESNPNAAFDRLFRDFKTPTAAPGTTVDLARVRAQRKSVLDFVQRSLERLRARIGAADRAKIDAHVEFVRGIERDLATAAPAGARCAAPAVPDRIGAGTFNNFHVTGRLNVQILAAAMSCDLTRVAVMMWGNGGNDGLVHKDLGVTTEYHRVAHQCELDNPGEVEHMVKIMNHHAEQLALVLARLSEIREGNGALADSLLAAWVTGFSNGGHVFAGLPVTIFAGSALGLRTNRYVQVKGVAINNLYVSMARALGVEIDTFGNPKHCTGPLSGFA
jgi:hypothetical protein